MKSFRSEEEKPEVLELVDLRLLLYALAIWLGALTAGVFSWRINLLLLALTIASFIFLKRYWIVVLGVLIGGLIYSIHFATLQTSKLAELARSGAEVTFQAVVTSDPKLTPNKVYGSNLSPPQQSFLARVHYLERGEQRMSLRLPVRILSKFEAELTPGDVISISGRLIVTREKRVAATMILQSQPRLESSAGELSKALSNIRKSFRSQAAALGGDSASLVPGMILGDTSLQTEEFSRMMRTSGLSHLTAVSGANFAIVSALVFWLSRFFFPKIKHQVLITAVFLFLFLLLVRPSPSVLRAGLMASVILIARATGNNRNAVSALAAAIGLLLLLDPFQSRDPGFVLSVLATTGLIFFSPPIADFLRRYLPSGLAEIVAISTAATLLCTPYIIFLSGEISMLSIAFNILVSPLIAPITIMGFVAVLTLPISIISTALTYFAELLARWIVLVASWSNNTPIMGLTFGLITVAVTAVFLLPRVIKRKSLAVTIIISVICLNTIPRLSFPGKNWKVVQCDVGQGDALVINLGEGSGVLFDAGPDPKLIDRCLRMIGIEHLALIVISHNHADHAFGLSGAVKSRQVDAIWSNGSVDVPGELKGIHAKVSAPFSAEIGNNSLEVIWPPAINSAEVGFESLPGDGSEENNRSLVVLVKLNGVNVLVTGDIEPEAQRQILRRSQLGSIDVLKLPHHGSRFQDTEFLAASARGVVLISVGRGNRYGHPDPELLSQLAVLGSNVRRTDLGGPISLSWRFDERAGGYIFTTKEMRKEWWRVQWR